MIDGTYAVEATTPLGTVKGTVTLTSNGAQASGVAKAVHQTFKAEGSCAGNTFEFAGEIRVLLKRAHYTMRGSVEGDRLQATASLGRHTVNVTGVRL